MIWIAAMLSSLAGFTRIFAEDVRCGWVGQVALSPLALPAYATAKAATHWIMSAVPMLLATPLMAMMLHMDMGDLGALLVSLVLGTAALTLLGVIGAALTEGARGGGGLMAVLVLPLAMPAIAVLALFSIMWRWNDFLWPLLVLNRSEVYTCL